MMKQHLFRLLKRYRKFAVFFLAFVIWMLFFDNRNVFVQKRLDRQIDYLEKEYTEYKLKLEEVKEEYRAMQMNPEKYAREKYFMHKPTEEVFIFRKK
jgi:cell division protein FtsB